MTSVPIAQKEKLNETLKVLESFLSNSKWFASNDEISIADISILPTVTTIKVN
jgi:glutathione S-transferase